MWILKSVMERMKALFVSHLAVEMECEAAQIAAERKAELLRQAANHDKEGLETIAQELRQTAERLSANQPLGSVLPTIAHLKHPDTENSTPLLTDHSANGNGSYQPNPKSAASKSKTTRKRGSRV